MIKIKDIKKSIGSKDIGFAEYVRYLLKPTFGGSELACHVNKKLGHLPPWFIDVQADIDKNGTLKKIGVIADIDRTNDSWCYELNTCKPNADKNLPIVVSEWFKEKGLPEPKSDPEGFVKRLVELYPELSDFVEIS